MEWQEWSFDKIGGGKGEIRASNSTAQAQRTNVVSKWVRWIGDGRASSAKPKVFVRAAGHPPLHIQQTTQDGRQTGNVDRRTGKND